MSKKDFDSVRRQVRMISRNVADERGGFFPGHQTIVMADFIRHADKDGYQIGGPNGDASIPEVRAAISSLDRGCDPLKARKPGFFSRSKMRRLLAPWGLN